MNEIEMFPENLDSGNGNGNGKQQPDMPATVFSMRRFQELQDELKTARQELAELKLAGQSAVPAPTQALVEPAPQTIDQMAPEQQLLLFNENPAAFVQMMVDQAAHRHLADLKDEAELNGAIRAIRREKPEFARFESFILQEVAQLIQNDPDGIIDPWQDLLEKGFEQFKKKFQETLKEAPEGLSAAQSAAPPPAMNPLVEGTAARQKPALPASFTREQIAAMSMAEFLANEAAINEALKGNRIR